MIWIKLWHGTESRDISPICGPDEDKIGCFHSGTDGNTTLRTWRQPSIFIQINLPMHNILYVGLLNAFLVVHERMWFPLATLSHQCLNLSKGFPFTFTIKADFQTMYKQALHNFLLLHLCPQFPLLTIWFTGF